jgi:hypothetical protein
LTLPVKGFDAAMEKEQGIFMGISKGRWHDRAEFVKGNVTIHQIIGFKKGKTKNDFEIINAT